MNVDQILRGVIRSEGGFTSDPHDTAHQKRVARGDKWDSYCTNMGITQFTLSEWLHRQATIEEVRGLDKETVKEMYEVQYYTKPRFNTLPASIQPVVTDAGILYGQPAAGKMLQQVINLAGFGPVDTDGVIGPQTRRAAEEAEREMGGYLVNALVEARIERANAIVAGNPSQSKYIRGWTNRANSFRVAV